MDNPESAAERLCEKEIHTHRFASSDVSVRDTRVFYETIIASCKTALDALPKE